jgi:hypothetical protein
LAASRIGNDFHGLQRAPIGRAGLRQIVGGPPTFLASVFRGQAASRLSHTPVVKGAPAASLYKAFFQQPRPFSGVIFEDRFHDHEQANADIGADVEVIGERGGTLACPIRPVRFLGDRGRILVPPQDRIRILFGFPGSGRRPKAVAERRHGAAKSVS